MVAMVVMVEDSVVMAEMEAAGKGGATAASKADRVEVATDGAVAPYSLGSPSRTGKQTSRRRCRHHRKRHRSRTGTSCHTCTPQAAAGSAAAVALAEGTAAVASSSFAAQVAGAVVSLAVG